MSNISQSGTYRGSVIDRGLSNSSGGHLQLEITMQATERYNEEAQVWEPFNYEDSEAQAYLNLVTGKEKENSVNCRQIMRALNWDGMSWSPLNDLNSGLAGQIQWRMGMETYNEVERCKVQGIDAYDAAPGRKVEKLDAAAVRALDAKYAGILKGLGGGPKPKTARPATPAPAADPTPSASGTPMPTPSTTPTPSASPESAKPKRGRPATPKAAAPKAAALSQADAWTAYTDKASDKTDLEVQNTWVAVVKDVYGGDENVGEDWSGVVAECLQRLGL